MTTIYPGRTVEGLAGSLDIAVQERNVSREELLKMDYIQLKTAIERFGEMLEAFRHNDQRPALEREAVQDSLIKRFEYTLEVAWKTCKRHLEEEGFVEAASGSPKSIIRLAAQRLLIANPEAWFDYLRFRQDTSHDYSSYKAESVFDHAEDFYRDVMTLYRGMTGESDRS